jgi:hypothetical protein
MAAYLILQASTPLPESLTLESNQESRPGTRPQQDELPGEIGEDRNDKE